MPTQRQNFYQAFSILNSLLVPVFILFLIDKINLLYTLNVHFIWILLITGPLKIYCLSALSGCVLEIISGEEFVPRIRRIHQNAKDLWPGFLIAFVIIFLIDFILLSPFHSLRIWRPIYFSLLGGLGAYALALWTINKKYIRPLGIPQRPFKFNLKLLILIISACFLELILVRILSSAHIGNFYWRNISNIIVNYIHIFEFILSSLYILDDYPKIKNNFSTQREIFLINPMAAAIIHSLGFRLFVPWYPPAFFILKALSPKTYKFREFNQVIWHDRYYKSDVLVCITCFTTNCYEAYKIAKEFKKKGSKVVMGGPHVTYLPNEALAFCDSVIIGPAEGVWKEVIRDYENGTLKSQYKGPVAEADYAQVHEELLSSPPHILKDYLETTRGCKFHCNFCSVPALSGGQVRTQTVNDFVELIKRIKPYYPKVRFIDNNIYSDPAYAKELFAALKPLKIKWQSACTIDIAKNEETLKLARESGCYGMFFGYEVSGGSFEKAQGGKFGMAQKYLEYTKIVKKSGISISGAFIFGFDSDSLKNFFQLWKFGLSIMPVFSHVAMLTPLPGSGLYRDMLAQNRIINLNWRSHDFSKMVFRHPRINHTLISLLFPLLRIFFLLTTSLFGLPILATILLLPHFMKMSTH